MIVEQKALVHLEDLAFEPYIDESQILKLVEQIAAAINADYEGKEITLVCVLKGSFVFVSDLIKYISVPIEVEFIRVSSYKGTTSTGELTLSLDYHQSIVGKHVIIVEDIIDTGQTAAYLLERAKKTDVASVKLATLLLKPAAVITNVEVDYIGMEIPDDFVVGYGMDYNEKGREIPSIYKLVKK